MSLKFELEFKSFDVIARNRLFLSLLCQERELFEKTFPENGMQ